MREELLDDSVDVESDELWDDSIDELATDRCDELLDTVDEIPGLLLFPLLLPPQPMRLLKNTVNTKDRSPLFLKERRKGIRLDSLIKFLVPGALVSHSADTINVGCLYEAAALVAAAFISDSPDSEKSRFSIREKGAARYTL